MGFTMGKLFNSLPDCFLKKVLTGEDPDLVENILNLKNQFEKEQDKEKKVVYKERLSSCYWNLFNEIAKKLNQNTTKEKRLMIRFGIFDLKYLSQEDQKLILSQKFEETDPENTIYYLDEWLIAVFEGKIKPSVVDEQPRSTAEKKDNALQSKYERLAGSVEAEKNNYRALYEKRKLTEDAILALVNSIIFHTQDPLLGNTDVYTDEQIQKMDEIVDNFRELKKLDKDMKSTKNSFYDLYEELRNLEQEINNSTNNSNQNMVYTVDSRTIESEIGAIRQMIKMTVGRQGNHFPILTSSLLPRETNEYNFKINAYKQIQKVVELDYTVFDRTWRQNTSRIPPYVILVPGYGNYGICWEPYDKYNKATSKGRIALPIFCKNPRFAVTVALGDFRWQCAKEMAGYHWMDPTEGLTGKYYEYITENKIKGDIKTLFIEDYILWITKESEGIQKLNKDVRYIFWRNVPFPDKLKEELSYKGFYYNELYKKEMTYRMSKN